MLAQAKALFPLSEGLDFDHIERRIREETARPMAFKTLKTKREAFSLTNLEERIAKRRFIVGPVGVPSNASKRRPPSKQALLGEILKAGGRW